MKTATFNLKNDHIHILRLIDVMESFVKQKASDVEDIELIVNLIKSYADGFHHAKEENLLFPLMVEKGFSNNQGPIAVMLHDHTEGRNFVKNMSESIVKYKNGDNSVLPFLFTNMNGYINLLRNHISKEDNVLFKMADNVLSEQDQNNLLLQFDKVEKSNFCGGVLNDCLTQIEKLAGKYLKN